jgi:hypothetical protein
MRPKRETGATLVNPTTSDARGSALIVNFLDLQWFGCNQQSNSQNENHPLAIMPAMCRRSSPVSARTTSGSRV